MLAVGGNRFRDDVYSDPSAPTCSHLNVRLVFYRRASDQPILSLLMISGTVSDGRPEADERSCLELWGQWSRHPIDMGLEGDSGRLQRVSVAMD